MTSPTPQQDLREAVARIVDPDSYRLSDQGRVPTYCAAMIADALAKADRILALISSTRPADQLSGNPEELEGSTLGWRVVPVVPTYEMLGEADSAIPRFEAGPDGYRLMGVDGARECWAAMIAAAPSPPSHEKEG